MRDKQRLGVNVLEAARSRLRYTFDNFERICVSFSGGKDSTVMLHLAAEEARSRGKRIGVLLVDLEGAFNATIEHSLHLVKEYEDCLDVFWVCLPLSLRNACSVFEPRWVCWDPLKEDAWIRRPPECAITDAKHFPFFSAGMEFEELVPEFAKWYAQGKSTATLVGIRADESLNRFRTIFSEDKQVFQDKAWTTRISEGVYNVYPIYDWNTADVWTYHGKNPDKAYNPLYDLYHASGLTLSQMRTCQPYGDDQRRGLWLFHLLEPQTWQKVLVRVSGANGGALYAQERGNVSGVGKITLPAGLTWERYAAALLMGLPPSAEKQYRVKIDKFIAWWAKNGFPEGIPDEASVQAESDRKAPSWRRVCKCILRNDYWGKSLGFSQPASPAYKAYLKGKRQKKGLR